MATKPSVKLYLALGGQQEFKSRLQACQKEVKTFQNELKALTDKYEGNANSIQALTAKQKALEGEQDALQRKMKAANEALEESTQDYDKCSKNLENLRDKLELATDQHDRFKKSVSAIEEYEKLTKSIDGQEKELIDLTKALKEAKENQDRLQAEGKEGTEEWERQRETVAKLEDSIEDLTKELDDNKAKQKELYETNKDAFKVYEDQEKQINQLEKAIEKEGSQVAECEKRMANWRGEVSNTEHQLESVEDELKQNAQYIEEAKSSYDGCATSIDRFGNVVGSQSDELNGLKNSVDGVGKEMNELADEASRADLGQFAKGIVNYEVAMNALVDVLRQVPQLLKECADFVIDVGSSFEAQMSKVSAISGAQGADLQALTDKAAEMGRTTKFTATEAGEALEYMAMAGWKTNDMLDGLEGIMNLAAASGEDLGTTSDIVTDALTAFGLSAKDSTHFADLLATASSNANTNVAMMGETFKYVAPAAGAMGYSAEDVAEAIGLMANSGIKASQAGTSLRSVITRLATDAGASSTQLGALGILTQRLGVQFYDSNGKARAFGDVIRETREAWKGLDDQQAATYAKQIAGQNAISGWLALMEASDADVRKLSESIANCDGTAAAMAGTMNNNLSGALTIFNSALEGLGIAVYNKVSGPLTDLIELGTDVISAITGWLTPAKSDLEAYIDEISQANEQIKANLETIESTLNKELAETSQLESYKSLFRDVVQDGEKLSSLSIADMVNAMVSDMGHLSTDGITVIDQGFLDAARDVGNLKESDILGGLLETSAGQAAGLTDGIGEGAETSKGKIDDLANAKVTGGELETSINDTAENFGTVDESAENSRQKVEDFFKPVANEDTFWITIDNVDKKMGVLTESEKQAADAKGELLGSTSIQVDHGFMEALEEIEGGLQNVILVTDDFQKRQVTKAIEHIAKLKPEAKDLWNEQYGILSNNVEILDELINMEEAYLFNQAFAKARAEYYDELGDAYLNMYKAESAANNLLEEINGKLADAGYDEHFESLSDALDSVYDSTTSLHIVTGDYEDVLKQTIDDVDDATKNVDTCKQSLDDLNGTQETAAKDLGLTQEQMESVNEVFDENTKATQQTTASVEELAEEEGNLTESTNQAAEATEELSKELQKAAEEGVKANQKALQELEKEYEKLREEYQKTIGTIATGKEWNYAQLGEDETAPDLGGMQATMQHNMDQLQQWKQDMQYLAEQVGTTISSTYFQSLLEQGPESGALIRSLVNDIRSGGGQAKALSDTFTQTMTETADMSNYFASLQTMLEDGFSKVAEGLNYRQFWNSIGDHLDNPEFWAEITDEQYAHLDAALQAANSVGAGIPEKLAEGVREGSVSAEEAIGVINDVIVGRLEGLRDQAQAMGATVPDGLIEGVKTGEVSAQEAFNTILDSMADYTHVESQGHAVGEYYVGAIADGISGDGDTIEYYNEAGEVIDRFTERLEENVDATGIGEKVAQDTGTGIKNEEKQATDQAETMVQDANDKATTKADGFTETGKKAVDKTAEGLKSNKQTFITEVDTMMRESIAKANEWDDDFNETGRDIPVQLGSGVSGNQSPFINAVDEVMRAGSEKASSYKGEFEGRGRELVEAIGSGASSNSGAVQNGVSSAVQSAQNVDTGGFYNIGIQIDNAVANGISQYQSIVTSAAQGMATSAYNAAVQALQIHSPSRKFRDGIGVNIPKGTAEGVKKGQRELEDTLELSMKHAVAVASMTAKENPLSVPLRLATSASELEASNIVRDAKRLIDADMPDFQTMVETQFDGVTTQVLANTSNVEGLIEKNTQTLERLIDCANLMLDAARAMSEKIGLTVINEIDGAQFDSRIKSVSQKAANQRAKQLAFSGGR